MSIIVVSRCRAKKSNGERCKSWTTKSRWCSKHLKRDKQLEIRESVIPDAGYGLFTTEVRVRGENICEYDGELKTGDVSGPYVLQVKKNPPTFIDAAKSKYLGRWANSARGTGWKNNAQLVWDSRNQKAWIRATTLIPEDHEIFVAYGSGYWHS